MAVEIFQNADRTSSLVVRDGGELTLVSGGVPVEQDITNAPDLAELLAKTDLSSIVASLR